MDDDTFAACLAKWDEDHAALPVLLKTPPRIGRLKSPQTMPYAQLDCNLDHRESAGTGGAWHDFRKVNIIIRGTRADVAAVLVAAGALFSQDTVLVYPSGARFIRWWPDIDDDMSQEETTKEGIDVWKGSITGTVWSIRLGGSGRFGGPQAAAAPPLPGRPTIQSVSPALGYTSGNTLVTIRGTGFFAGTTITFGGIQATEIMVQGDTSLTCRVPNRSTGAQVDVSAVNAGNPAGVLPQGYSYIGTSTDLWNQEGSLWNQANFLWAAGSQPSVALPFTVPGLVTWFNPQLQTYQDAALATPAVLNNDPVGGWNDSVLTGHKVTQATAGNRPLLILAGQNSLPILRFDGTNDFLRGLKMIASARQPFTLFLAFKLNSLSGTPEVMDTNNTLVGGSPRVYLFNNGGTWEIAAGTALDGGTVTSGWHQYTLTMNGASSSLRVDGAAASSGTAGANALESLTLGGSNAATPGNPVSMDLGDWLIYTGGPPVGGGASVGLMSAGNRNSIESYLRTRWGTP